MDERFDKLLECLYSIAISLREIDHHLDPKREEKDARLNYYQLARDIMHREDAEEEPKLDEST